MNTLITTHIVLPFVMSFGAGLVLVNISMRIARKLGLVDNPMRPHPGVTHTKPIPRTGGIALFLTYLSIALLFLEPSILTWGVFIGAGLNAVVGVLDDTFSLSPLSRLSIQILSAVVVIWGGVEFYTRNPFGEGLWYYDMWTITLQNIGVTLNILADLLLIFWIVWIINTTNWTKGASQLPGVAAIAFITIAGVALQYQSGNGLQLQTAILASTCAGATLALLPFNFPPEKLFPNFGASTFIGFNLAVLSVLSGGKIATLLIVFAIPIIDSGLVGIKRIINKKSPLVHDREHFYHFLMDNGLTKRQIIYFYWVTALLFGLTTLFLQTRGKVLAIITLFIIITTFFIFLYKRKHREITK